MIFEFEIASSDFDHNSLNLQFIFISLKDSSPKDRLKKKTIGILI